MFSENPELEGFGSGGNVAPSATAVSRAAMFPIWFLTGSSRQVLGGEQENLAIAGA